MDLIRILLSILLPPVGVFLQVGIGLHFWLNNLADAARLYSRHRARGLDHRPALKVTSVADSACSARYGCWTNDSDTGFPEFAHRTPGLGGVVSLTTLAGQPRAGENAQSFTSSLLSIPSPFSSSMAIRVLACPSVCRIDFVEQRWDSVDTDGDGQIDEAELRKAQGAFSS